MDLSNDAKKAFDLIISTRADKGSWDAGWVWDELSAPEFPAITELKQAGLIADNPKRINIDRFPENRAYMLTQRGKALLILRYG